MIKWIAMLLIYEFVSSVSYGQMLSCEKLKKQIEADTSKSIWDYDSLPPDSYYCLGKYFAQRDIDKKIFLIQTYGLPEWQNPCIVCRYKSYGFRYYYHEDIILEEITKFIEGYNEISKAYLKTLIGDSAFAHIEDEPNNFINPVEVLRNSLENGKHQRFFNVDRINDTTINVKLNVDSLFRDYPKFKTEVVYSITDYDFKNKTQGQTLFMNYNQIKEVGFCLNEKSNDKYYLKINFAFKTMDDDDNLYISNEKGTVYMSQNSTNKKAALRLTIDDDIYRFGFISSNQKGLMKTLNSQEKMGYIMPSLDLLGANAGDIIKAHPKVKEIYSKMTKDIQKGLNRELKKL